MAKTIKNIIETLIFPEGTCHTLLPLQSPLCRPFPEAAVCVAGISEVPAGYSVVRHNPVNHEVLFTLDGAGILNIGEKSLALKGNDVMVLPAGSSYRYESHEVPWHILWFHLYDQEIWAGVAESQPHVRPGITVSEIYHASERLLAEHIGKDTASSRLVSLLSEQVVLLLKRELAAEDSAHDRQLRQLLHGLWTDVNAQLGHNWTVAAMAERLNMSPAHFHRVCLRYAGCSPVKMLFRLRMQRAEEMLVKYNYGLKSISETVGYGTPFAFSNAFRRYKGISPREYRSRFGEMPLSYGREEP